MANPKRAILSPNYPNTANLHVTIDKRRIGTSYALAKLQILLRKPFQVIVLFITFQTRFSRFPDPVFRLPTAFLQSAYAIYCSQDHLHLLDFHARLAKNSRSDSGAGKPLVHETKTSSRQDASQLKRQS